MSMWQPDRDVAIRPARIDDVPAMCDLLKELFSIESGFAPDRAKQAAGLALLLDAGEKWALVLVAVSDRVIGMATVQTVISTAEGGWTGLVEDVIVDRRFRGFRIGTRLLDGIAAWSRDKGLTRLQLLADVRNGQAANFYSSRGWSFPGFICMRKML